jgi:HK97 family phage prohead protease
MREYKAIISTNIKAESGGRTRTGIAAVFGNVDAVGDRIMPGAFIRTINNSLKRVKHLWNHSWEHPPLAKIVELREVSRTELPEEVLEKAPTATGGLLVKREYYKNDLSDWILQAIDADDVNEMSFAFDVVRSENVEEKGEEGSGTQVRELLELALFDTSDVLWGANSATVAIGAKAVYGGSFQAGLVPPGIVANQLAMIRDGAKAGTLDVAANADLFKFIHDTAIELGAVCNSNTDNPPEVEPAPAISDSTALLHKRNRARLNELRLYRSNL